MANNIPFIAVGDTLELKKTHPCGGRLFKVVRVGSEVRIICESCGRDLTLDRIKIEKMIKKIIHADTENKSDGARGE